MPIICAHTHTDLNHQPHQPPTTSTTNHINHLHPIIPASTSTLHSKIPNPRPLTLDSISLPHRTHAWSYLPYNSLSAFHYLNCGHRTKTTPDAHCGTNCSQPLNPVDTALICRACMSTSLLDSLSSPTSTDIPAALKDDTPETQLLKSELDERFVSAVQAELEQGHRDGIAVPKTNGIERFVAEHGKGVLKDSRQDVGFVEQAFWGLEINSAEDQIDTIEGMLAALGGSDIIVE